MGQVYSYVPQFGGPAVPWLPVDTTRMSVQLSEKEVLVKHHHLPPRYNVSGTSQDYEKQLGIDRHVVYDYIKRFLGK